MELSVNRNTVRINEPVLDCAVDHPLECDVVLPDYCPDIARILNTDAGATINKKTIETDCLTADGTFFVKIIYVPDNSCCVRCFTYENDFTHTFEAQGLSDGDMATVKSRVDYITCRQIGPRRMQIKASINLCAKAWRCRDEEVVSNCDDSRVEMLSKTVKESCLVGASDKIFDAEQEFEIAYTKPQAAAIVKCDATPVVKDCKVIKNKIVAKGEINLNTMYSPDISTNNLEVVSNTLPMSQIIDLDGVDEDSVCDVDFTILNLRIDASPDDDGENRLLNCSCTVICSAKAWNTKEVTVTRDAYSPVYEMNLETKAIQLERICDVSNSDEAVKFTVDAPGDGISSVVDCMMKLDKYDEKIDGNNLCVSGEMTAEIMALDMQGSPVCFQKTMPFTITRAMPPKCECTRADTSLHINSSAFSFSANCVDIRVECSLTAIFFETTNAEVVTGMTLDESAPRKQCGKTLTLYYADKGEKIWDIAKKYNTSMEAVMKENNFETETVPQRLMLLIPKKHCAKTKETPNS